MVRKKSAILLSVYQVRNTQLESHIIQTDKMQSFLVCSDNTPSHDQQHLLLLQQWGTVKGRQSGTMDPSKLHHGFAMLRNGDKPSPDLGYEPQSPEMNG